MICNEDQLILHQYILCWPVLMPQRTGIWKFALCPDIMNWSSKQSPFVGRLSYKERATLIKSDSLITKIDLRINLNYYHIDGKRMYLKHLEIQTQLLHTFSHIDDQHTDHNFAHRLRVVGTLEVHGLLAGNIAAAVNNWKRKQKINRKENTGSDLTSDRSTDRQMCDWYSQMQQAPTPSAQLSVGIPPKLLHSNSW